MEAKKPTAVWLIETLNCGGTENVLLRLIPELDKLGWRSVVVTMGPGGEMLAQYQAAGIEVKALDQPNIFSLRSIRQTAQIINDLQPAIIISNLLRADIIGRLALPFFTDRPILPLVVSTYNDRKYWPARTFEWLSQPFAKGYIANSKAVKDFLVGLGVKPSKVTVITNGLDVRAFQAAATDHIVKELKLPAKRLVVVCVGNLAPNKGQAELIDGFDRVFGSRADAFLVLVGEGAERANLEAQRDQAASKDRIFLLGRRTDVPSILKVSDIFAFPTHFEGMSTALLEAMAAGLAITTTNIPENQVILTDQKTALMFPPRDVPALAETLMMLERDSKLRQNLGQAAEHAVEANYSITTAARQFVTVFKHYEQR